MSTFQQQLRHLIADRHTAEAKALYELLLKYIHRRVDSVSHTCWSGMFSASEREEIVAEVLLQLMTHSLAAFRGDSLPELFGYVRTISDRTLWRAASRRRRERLTLDAEADTIESWNGVLPGPEEAVRLVPDIPLGDSDQTYLRALLEAGSKVEHARRQGVSRAAVTQRVQRIRRRISRLSPTEQQAVEVWLEQTARQVLEAAPPG